MKRFKHPQSPTAMLGKGTELNDLFLQVRINGDVALLKALMLLLLDEEAKAPGKVLDQSFIASTTQGYEAFLAHLKQHSFDALAQDSGVPVEKIKEAAKKLASKSKIIFCWAMGLTQHKNGVGNVREIVNLLLMKGSIGKPGAGTCPVRGHSNVQGDRTMGIWERPRPEFLDRMKTTFGFEPPREHGYDVVSAIEALHEGKAKVFFAMGGNFLSATPDTEYTAEALRKCELTVHVSTKLNRSHLVHGKTAIILPCLGRSERDEQVSGYQFVTVENSMGKVNKSEGKSDPISNHLRSEPAIVAYLAKATLGDKYNINWENLAANYDGIRNLIEKSIDGFEGYNIKVRQPNGFYLPNCSRDRSFTPLHGKAKFTVNDVPENPIKEGQFLMMTIRSHDQFNTTIYGLNDRYRGIYNERRVVLMNEEDMKEIGLSSGQSVDLQSHFEGEKRNAESFFVVPYHIPKQCIATYFPEANVLVPIKSKADKSHTPAYKSVVVTILKHRGVS